MLKKRKPESPQEHDPMFLFYVGRLVGASEVASSWLLLQNDPTMKEMGKSLDAVGSWFLATVPRTSQEITQIIPPRK